MKEATKDTSRMHTCTGMHRMFVAVIVSSLLLLLSIAAAVGVNSDLRSLLTETVKHLRGQGQGAFIHQAGDLRQSQRALQLSATLKFNSKVYIRGESNTSPNTYATMNADRRLEFGASSGSATQLIVRHVPGSGTASDNQCVRWNDKIWLAFTTASYRTSNCGWYGCRVARVGDSLALEFAHGTHATAFHVRPRGGNSSSGCVTYADEVFLAAMDESNETPSCGWWGCRVFSYIENSLGVFTHGRVVQQSGGIYFANEPVDFNSMVRISGSANALPNTMAKMNSNNKLEFGSGTSNFIVRREPGARRDSNCIRWNDKIWIAFTAQSYRTSTCGWYGCRVANMNDSKQMQFSHGNYATSFYVRPPRGSTSSASSTCVMYGDEILLAYTPETSQTSNCGWYGCRVFKYVANGIGFFDHGTYAIGIYFTKT